MPSRICFVASSSNSSSDSVNLADDDATKHILDGDKDGGGHGPGRGVPGKSEFPSGWTDEEVMEGIEKNTREYEQLLLDWGVDVDYDSISLDKDMEEQIEVHQIFITNGNVTINNITLNCVVEKTKIVIT